MVQPSAAMVADSTDRSVHAAHCIADAIIAVLEQIQASPDTSSVKRLGRLIEDQRRALALCGFHSFAAFEAALDAASGDHVAEARKRLQGAEAAWRELLAANEASFGSISRLAVGDPAPKLELPASTGQRISLQEILANSPSGVLMVWLRHFG
ncbi:unnamed protein product [Effrenium voratum]|nr:unnamed protein product [Effrenium voratum]